MSKVHYSEINKLWYLMCPVCKVTHAFGPGHGFNGNFDSPTLQGSIGWTGMNSEDKQVYCHSTVKDGIIIIDDHGAFPLPDLTETI